MSAAREDAARAVEVIALARGRLRIRTTPCKAGKPHDLAAVSGLAGEVNGFVCRACGQRWTREGSPCR